MQHLGRADAVDQLDAGRLASRARASRRAAPRRRRRTCAGCRRRARRCCCSRAPAAIARYEVGAVKQTVARCATIASSRSGGPAFSSSTVEAPMCIGNSVSPPRPKVKASGGLPMKTSSGVGAQHVRREADAARHHVAMEVHRRLRLAGGAGGEGEQAGVVGGGVDVGERRVVARHQRFEAVGRVASPKQMRERVAQRASASRGSGGLELAAQRARRRARSSTCALLDDLPSSLARSIGIVRDRDAAGLHHREPAGDQHRLVGGAQQHAVAGHEAAVVRRARGRCGRPGAAARRRSSRAAGRADAAPVAAAFLHVRGRAARWRSSGARGTAARAGRSRNSGCASGGGRWSRAKVSTWAVYGHGPWRSLLCLRTPRSR